MLFQLGKQVEKRSIFQLVNHLCAFRSVSMLPEGSMEVKRNNIFITGSVTVR